jgi:hypothetical protein
LTVAGAGRLSIRGLSPLSVDNDGDIETAEARLDLPAGSVPLEAEYLRRGGQPAVFLVEWEIDGLRTPLAAPHLLAAPSAAPLWLSHWLIGASRVLDCLYLATLVAVGWLILRPSFRAFSERHVLALILLASYLYAALTTLDLHRRVVLLGGGDDFLTYETYARDILQNGPLMTLGRPLGKGRSFIFQPFYPYALAASHWLTGEDLYGTIVLQLFGVGVAAVLVFYLGKRLFGAMVGALALAAVLGLLGPLQFEWVARRLLSENLYIVLLPASALAALRLAESPTARRGLVAGALLGLSSVTRGPTLGWIPPVFWIVKRELRSRTLARPADETGEPAGRVRPWSWWLAIATCLLIVALVPLRNYVVSGQVSLVAANTAATLELAHPLTPAVDLDGVEKNPIYRALRLEYALVQTIEFIRQDPVGYLATLVPLALYALGVPGMLEKGNPVRWELVALVVLYVISLTQPSTRRRQAWLLHSFIALHFLVMLIFLPNNYGYRQVLPMYLFIGIFAAWQIQSWLVHVPRRRSPEAELQQHDGAETPPVEKYVQSARPAARHKELA